MKFGNKVCPNCNGKLDLNNGMFECSFCGCSFAADFDSEDVERIRKETEAERNAAKALRESELNRTKEDLKYNRYTRPSTTAQPTQYNQQYSQPTTQPTTQNTGRRRSKARIIVPIVIGGYVLLQIISIIIRNTVQNRNQRTFSDILGGKTTTETTTVTTTVTSEETQYDFSFDASIISSNEEMMDKLNEASNKILESDRVQSKYGTTSDNELVAGYLFSTYYTNDLFLVYESKCEDGSSKYICVYYNNLMPGDDSGDTIYCDYTAHIDDVYDSVDDARAKLVQEHTNYSMSKLDIG
ncbi:MAG: hypothetical protein J6U23_04180 [Clostridiales bacterium]|nr:hypothetical protein [Clostridiales bacterium]